MELETSSEETYASYFNGNPAKHSENKKNSSLQNQEQSNK